MTTSEGIDATVIVPLMGYRNRELPYPEKVRYSTCEEDDEGDEQRLKGSHRENVCVLPASRC